MLPSGRTIRFVKSNARWVANILLNLLLDEFPIFRMHQGQILFLRRGRCLSDQVRGSRNNSEDQFSNPSALNAQLPIWASRCPSER